MSTDSANPSEEHLSPNQIIKLAVMMAHRVHDELHVVAHAADLLLNNITSQQTGDHVTLLKERIDEVASLAWQFLALANRRDRPINAIDVAACLHKLAPLLQRIADETQAVSVTADTEVWPITADAEQFQRVIIALAYSALEAMPNGGRLAIRASNLPAISVSMPSAVELDGADHVMIELADTGVEVPSEALERLDDPFPSAHPRASFGLASAYHAIKTMGGQMMMVPANTEGMVVRVVLPRGPAL